MIISDEYIYLHLPKCGGNFIKNFISNKDPQARFTQREHMSIAELSSEDYANREIYITIRNPWDWYVSWYEYSRSHKTQWWNVFSENTDGSFEKVMENLFLMKESEDYIDRQYTTSHAWRAPMPVFEYMRNLQCGWYTFRLLQIVLENNVKIFEKKGANFEKLLENSKIKFQKLETIDKNMKNFASMHLKIERLDERIFEKKVNKSNRSRYQNYYNKNTIDLVRHGDKIFSELFDYSFESGHEK